MKPPEENDLATRLGFATVLFVALASVTKNLWASLASAVAMFFVTGYQSWQRANPGRSIFAPWHRTRCRVGDRVGFKPEPGMRWRPGVLGIVTGVNGPVAEVAWDGRQPTPILIAFLTKKGDSHG